MISKESIGVEISNNRLTIATAKATLKQKLPVRYGDIVILQDGDGLRAVGPKGEDLGSHQAFWFAWSQFHPTTVLWPEDVR